MRKPLLWFLLISWAGQCQRVMWRPPREVSPQLWTCGAAGCDQAPAPPFRFVKEDMDGTSPKLSVKDGKGRTWSVKFGAKVVSECFSSRFVTALGYFVEPSYYVASGKLEGAERLRRSRSMVHRDGTFGRARFQLRDDRTLKFLKDHAWSLADNPFPGTHELAGLRVLMMLLSNWDAKDSRDGQQESNTGIFESSSGGHPELLYSLFDWGSTLGRWGGFVRRTRSDCSGFAGDTPRYVKGVRGNVVEFGYVGKHEHDVRDGITVDDIRWLAPLLQRITDEEIRAGLKASGATERQTACWAGALEERMRQLETIARSGPVSH